MKEWLGPIAAGLIAAGLVLAIPESNPPAPFVPTPDDPGVIFVFPSSPQALQPSGEVLVIAKDGTPEQVTWHTGAGPAHSTTIAWHGPIGTVAMQEPSAGNEAPAPWIIEPAQGPGFVAANQTVLLTLYAFNAEGELVASNAPARDIDRFRLYGDFILLSDDPWALGNATPPGALRLPFGADLAAQALDGLPVGGVATLHVATHPYDWLVGELWLTGRIDGFAGPSA